MLRRISALVLACVSVVAMSCSQVPVTKEIPTPKEESSTPKEETPTSAKTKAEAEAELAELVRQFKDRRRERLGKAGEHFDAFMTEMAGIKNFTLFEGLPHQTSEKDLLEKELKEKQTANLHGFNFYREPIPISKKLNQRLQELCLAPENYEVHWHFGQAKFCCEFHPDWCLEFRKGEDVYHIQICFGCSEAKICGPKDNVHADLKEPVAKELRELLKPLQKNRPNSQEKE